MLKRTLNRNSRVVSEEAVIMKPSTKDEIAGNVHEVKGKIKENVGRVINSPDLEGEGIGENLAGKVQKKIGQVEKVIEKS
jgi:uncharacterized protein YjbJ (UPF0337 family)